MVAPRYNAMRAPRYRVRRWKRAYEERHLAIRDEDDELDSDLEADDSDSDDELEPQSVSAISATPATTPPPPTTESPTFSPISEPTPFLPSSQTPSFITELSSSQSIVSTALPTSASSLSTSIVSASPTMETAVIESSSPASSIIFIGQQDSSGNNDRNGGDNRPPPLHEHNKYAIAFGVVGAVGFLVGLIWAALMIRRRRRRRNQDTQSPQDYASSIGKSRNFFKSPFKRSSATSISTTSSFGNIVRPIFSRPLSKKIKRSDASIMDEAIRAAYGTDGDTVPKGFLDEKKYDPNYPLPLLEPEPIFQASIRQSIANWFKRSSGHHPLKLNPMSRWSRSTRASSRNASSIYSDAPSNRSSIPPVPPLNLKKTETIQVSPVVPTEPVELPVPTPVFTRDDAQAYYKSMWAGSTESERMSMASSWTSGTRSTMRASAAPNTAGLSPPTYYLGDNSRRGTMMTDPTTPSAGGTAMREELYNLYEQSEAEFQGLGLQRFETMGKK